MTSRTNRILCLTAALCVALVLATTTYGGIVTNTANGKSGRFIRITNNGDDSRRLNLGEVEAFLHGVTPDATDLDNTNDVALLSAGASFESQVGTTQHGANTAPINGGIESSSSTFSINAGAARSMTYDLGVTRDLGTIRTWNRNDCCWDRLKNYTIELLADSGGSPGATVWSQVYPGQNPDPTAPFLEAESAKFTLASSVILPGGAGAVGTDTYKGTDSQYIRVFTGPGGTGASPSNVLHIAEIKAYEAGADVALGTAGASAFTLDGGSTHGANAALIDTTLDIGSATWTRGTGRAEAFVNLGQTRFLETITIHQRNDGCCQDRLQNFTLQVDGPDGATRFSQAHPGQVATNSFATFTLPDAFTIASGDVLEAELNAAATTADVLKIGTAGGGTLTIADGATLNISNLGGALTVGQTFDLIDAGTITGTFTAIALPAGVAIDDTNLYTTGQITITAIPEPSTLALAAVGLLGLRRRRRK